MKMTTTRFAMLALLATLAWTLPALAQPDTVRLEAVSAYKGGKQRAGVTMNHLRHMEIESDCAVCHHRYQNGKNIIGDVSLEPETPGLKCADCHATPGKAFAPGLDPAKTPLREAFHQMCISCHTKNAGKMDGSVKLNPPRTCAGCHKNKVK